MKTEDNPTTVCCPCCRKTVVYSKDNPFRPFCSDKCRLVDLSQWFDEDYKIESDDRQDPPPSCLEQ